MKKFINLISNIIDGTRMIKSETFIKDNHSISQFIFTTKRTPFCIEDIIIIAFFAFISVLQYKDYIGNKESKFLTTLIE